MYNNGIMDNDSPEEFADAIRDLMDHFNLPYVKISIYNEQEDGPISISLKYVSLKIEALINALLSDIMLAHMNEAGYLLNQLENQVDSLLAFSAYLRLQNEKSRLDFTLSDKMEEAKSEKRNAAQATPIPKIFSDILKNINTPKKDEKVDKPAPKKAAKAKKTDKPSAKKAENEDK